MHLPPKTKNLELHQRDAQMFLVLSQQTHSFLSQSSLQANVKASDRSAVTKAKLFHLGCRRTTVFFALTTEDDKEI